jgi:hypothetical protein
MVISSPSTASAATPLAQYGTQPSPQPLVDLSQFAGMDMFEVGIPALQRPIDVRYDGFHASAIVPARPGFDPKEENRNLAKTPQMK